MMTELEIAVYTMLRRDFFAGCALIGILSGRESYPHSEEHKAILATQASHIADAMLRSNPLVVP